MIHLNLNIEEREAIINVLESYLSNLRYEIADTDNMKFRNGLKERKVLLTKLLNTLKQSVDNANPLAD